MTFCLFSSLDDSSNALVIGITKIPPKLNMVSFTNSKASMSSAELKFLRNCSIYLLIENPFPGALLPWDNDVATLMRDAISGNFCKPSSSKTVLSKDMISLLISILVYPDLAPEITGRSAS